MLAYDAIYIGLTSLKTLVALIMVVFIITIFYYECWIDFVRFVIDHVNQIVISNQFLDMFGVVFVAER